MSQKHEHFVKYKYFYLRHFRKSGWSLGIHFSQTFKRIDIHVLTFMISIGKIPIHAFHTKNGWKAYAVSDSYHKKVVIDKKIVLYAEPTCLTIVTE